MAADNIQLPSDAIADGITTDKSEVAEKKRSKKERSVARKSAAAAAEAAEAKRLSAKRKKDKIKMDKQLVAEEPCGQGRQSWRVGAWQ